jgi:hypothetical protein
VGRFYFDPCGTKSLFGGEEVVLHFFIVHGRVVSGRFATKREASFFL